MAEEMQRAKEQIKDREEKKALTHGAAKEGQLAAPNMNIQGAKMGKMARGRHQLTTLLAEAYQNREALEDRIAQGKRNRKEAGNKYGMLLQSYLLDKTADQKGPRFLKVCASIGLNTLHVMREVVI